MIVIPLDSFWINWWGSEKLNFKKSNINYYIICDNATIHKSKLISDFLIENNIRMVTISPYSPALNAAEKIILAIKQKVNKEVDNGK